MVLVMCCYWATDYLSNIFCPSKVGQGFNRPEALQPSSVGTTVCSNRGSNTRPSIEDLLRDNPASPPYTARKSREQPPRQYRQRKQSPFVPPAPSQRRLRYMIYPSSPCSNPESFSPPSTFCSVRQKRSSSSENSENVL